MKVVLRRVAAAEVMEARRWFEARRHGLGVEFMTCVETALRAIRRHPDRYLRVHGDVRRVLLARFPYAVFYLVETRRIVVLAVFHCARDPEIWKSR